MVHAINVFDARETMRVTSWNRCLLPGCAGCHFLHRLIRALASKCADESTATPLSRASPTRGVALRRVDQGAASCLAASPEGVLKKTGRGGQTGVRLKAISFRALMH
jgi:hypothetical protein